MNEVLSNTKLTLERLITLLIPGSIASMPYFWLAYKKLPTVHAFIDTKEGLATAVLIILSVAVGLVLEDIGSRLELLLEKIKAPKNFKTVWVAYLHLKADECKSIVAQGYLRGMLLRMKFELSFAISVFVASFGIHLMHHEANFMVGSDYWCLVGWYAPAGLILYMVWEAYTSGKELHENRERVLKALEQLPQE